MSLVSRIVTGSAVLAAMAVVPAHPAGATGPTFTVTGSTAPNGAFVAKAVGGTYVAGEWWALCLNPITITGRIPNGTNLSGAAIGQIVGSTTTSCEDRYGNPVTISESNDSLFTLNADTFATSYSEVDGSITNTAPARKIVTYPTCTISMSFQSSTGAPGWWYLSVVDSNPAITMEIVYKVTQVSGSDCSMSEIPTLSNGSTIQWDTSSDNDSNGLRPGTLRITSP